MAPQNVILKICLFLCITGGGLHAQELIQVADELSCDAAPTVYIGNVVRRVTVRTTHENKVRLVTTVAYEGNCRYTNEQWLDKLELKVSGNTGYVNVKCGNMEPLRTGDSRPFPSSSVPFPSSRVPRHRIPDLPQRRTINNLTPNGTVVFDADGNWLYKKGNIRRDITVYVPVGAKLEIDVKYAEIILDSNARSVNARIENGGITMQDADQLVLNSTYGSVYAANIGNAEVTLRHGWFHAKNIATLDMSTEVSTVELDAIGRLKINSNDDQYDIEKAGLIYGGKNYGSIRIDTLAKSLDLTGVNADIKVHNIERGVSLVKIDGQYADLRLPIVNLKDYTIHFEGKNSNLYMPFETPQATDSALNVTVGTGKKNSFKLKCSNCTVDMK